jgi:4-amino-4-deoxy-L-arabinose transferase-like glycosyltransferase
MRPSQLLWAVVGLNAMLWTILPWAVATSPALDVVEGIIWGQEWQWGYYKHPPLPSTFLYLIWLVLPDLAPFIASQICIAATLYFVYRLGQSTIGEERAVVGCLLLFGLYHFTFPSPQFNHNVAQMPLWAAAYYFGWRACEGGRLRDWALTGLVVGLALLAKYSSLLIVAALGLYWLVHHRHHRHHRQPRPPWQGPLLAGTIALLVFAPHLLWLVAHDFLPIHYLMGRASSEPSGWSHLIQPLRFLGSQFAAHLPMLIVLGIAGLLSARHWRAPVGSDTLSGGLRYLVYMALVPVALVLLLSLASGAAIRDEWGVPMWNLSGLLLASLFATHAGAYRKVVQGAALSVLLFAVLYLGYSLHAVFVGSQVKRNLWPAHEIGSSLQQVWQTETGGCPLAVVSGPYWAAGLVSVYASERPSVLIEGDLALSPWLSAGGIARTGLLRVSEQPLNAPGEAFVEIPSRVRNAPPVRLYWSVAPPNLPCTNTPADRD